MKLSAILALAGALITTGLQAQSLEDLAKIKFTGVQSIEIVEDGLMRVAVMKVQISNSSSSEILIADAQFDMTFNVDGKSFIHLPVARPVKEFRLSKGSMMSASRTTVEVAVLLGEANETTTNGVLIPLFNLTAGERKPNLTVVLDGKIRFGVKMNETTFFHQAEVRWDLVPKTSDRVVFSN